MSQRELVASCYCNCLSKVRRYSDLLEACTVCLTFVSDALSYRYAVRVIHAVLFLELSLHSLEMFVATSNNESPPRTNPEQSITIVFFIQPMKAKYAITSKCVFIKKSW